MAQRTLPLLITATRLPNGIDHWKGYIAFIGSWEAEGWWS